MIAPAGTIRLVPNRQPKNVTKKLNGPANDEFTWINAVICWTVDIVTVDTLLYSEQKNSLGENRRTHLSSSDEALRNIEIPLQRAAYVPRDSILF
jgi:hypothetical protein